MTDLKNEIAEKIRPFVRGNSVEMNSKHAFEAADVAIETVIARIPPLVWDMPENLNGWEVRALKLSGFSYDALDLVEVALTPYGYFAVFKGDYTWGWRFSPCSYMASLSLCETFSTCDHTQETAKAAANAHHVAQLCKGMRIK